MFKEPIYHDQDKEEVAAKMRTRDLRIGNPRRRGTVLRKKKMVKRKHLASDGTFTDSILTVRGEPISTSTDKEEVTVDGV